ncbi:MAG: hypothetical protein J6M22_03065 [Firmicutes bacterium]|nr:hypothetical protein [Bacillota bacterium]
MTYIIGAVAGLVFGGIIGSLKSLFIWKKYGEEDASGYGYQAGGNSIYARAMISYFVNILTLLAVFLVRNIVPFDGIAFLIATALTLALMNHVWALRQKKAVKTN